MKRFLIAGLLAASTLGAGGAAMAADNGNRQSLDRASAQTQFVGGSAGSFGAQQAAMYNRNNGE